MSLRTRRALVLSHRWIGLVGGLLVVIVSTSGALLVYQPELVRALHPEMFHTTPSDNPAGFTQAIAEVRSHYPELQLASASLKDGVYLLRASSETHDTFFVDAGTGLLNGRLDLGAGTLGFLVNMHDCGFTCEGYSGYLPFLAQPCPLAQLGAFAGLSWGSALLAFAAAVLLLLVIPAPFIWWKAIRKLSNALRIRWSAGRFARDFDLHAVIGIVATVPLLVWAVTGLQFEAPGLTNLWYSLTGGQPSERAFTGGHGDEDVTVERAMAVAESHFPGSEVTWIGMPDEDNPYYTVDLLDPESADLRAHSLNYHGNRSIGVDAHDAGHVQVLRGKPTSASNAIADEWAGPAAHFGLAVNGYWRAMWFVLGMAPLLLALTGLSTWQWRRRARLRTRVRNVQIPAAAGPAPASATRTTSPAAEQVKAR
ncbi:PepSY-associated TM helix domain-containing protein [Mycobacteroides franklinii]|uniref:PepSY domain-containing protein n=1 Tax=Mycobacteroides franklinii TaxID=948102 RepID=A0A4R5PDW3_9MYCO|nr:PepSY-associated TM helix domain-containing protein [Mycobacteroides franklinii]ORA64500.1 peptidase [Mycobacteroides franklinii]TDH22922.1 PepSY domain-containing protein [Mycobacteroides franklinii]